jgi:hypothetical protein
MAEIPNNSKIEVVESTPDRLLLCIPAGGKQSGGLGCLALLWNAIVCLVSIPFTIAIIAGKMPALDSLFLGVFWTIGLGMAYFWLKMKFERMFVLVERTRLAVQKLFFSRKRVDQIELEPTSQASLGVVYTQNDNPVYRVEVSGQGKTVRFGTRLADDEKDWIVDTINEFLGVKSPSASVDAAVDDSEEAAISTRHKFPDSCPKCAAPLNAAIVDETISCEHCGAVCRGELVSIANTGVARAPIESFERFDAESLATDGPIFVDESSPDRLRFHYAAAGNASQRWIVPAFTIPFSLVWYGALFSVIAGGIIAAPLEAARIFMLLFMIPFLIAGLIPLSIGLLALAGRVSVDLGPESLSRRLHVGPFGFSQHIPTGSITRVAIESRGGQRNFRVQTTQKVNYEHKGCVVYAGEKTILLTVFHDESFARQIARLIQTKLEDFGIRL